MQLTIAKAEEAMRKAGVRRTRQRMLIIQELLDNYQHPTAEQLYAQLMAKDSTISLATVYHTLALFARLGLIRELHGSKEALRCDPVTAAHAHAYCSRCGAVFDFPQPPAANIPAVNIPGFQPISSEFSVFGYCAACLAEENTPALALTVL